MDYVAEAKKFIARAAGAHSPDVVKEHLKMAEWCLGQEIEERAGPVPADGKAVAAS
jgi:hypothetical protein